MARALKPKPLYSCSIIDEGASLYSVSKYNVPEETLQTTPWDEISIDDYEEESVYKVEHSDNRATCECYAGLSQKYCRHKQIVDIFKATPNKLGSIHYYNFDRKRWE